MKTVYVRDYVQLPCEDASAAIRCAIQDAVQKKANELVFESGIYPLHSFISYCTDASGHDLGSTPSTEKEVLLLVHGAEHLTIRGATDPDGNPTTVLAGINTLKPHSMQPAILWCDQCRDLTVENLVFTRAPEFASAGRITEIIGDTLTVEVSEGCPCYDGMPTHCMNRFTPDGKNLNGESLSYGPGLGVNFHQIGDRLLSLKSEGVASRVEVGDYLSWHQGAKTDFQCFFGRMQNLTLRNLHTRNANGFAMLAFDCHNLYADRIVFKPVGNQLFTAPRDAWKLHRCSGRVEISRMYVEGVRMDGQNVHNNYLFVLEKKSDSSLLVLSENGQCDFVAGALMSFYADEKLRGQATLKSATHLSTEFKNNRILQCYLFDFAEPLTFDTEEGMAFLPECFAPDLYYCHDSQFRNIAGAGHLLRVEHVRIENCTYENTMNAGIQLGAEFEDFHEGGNCSDVVIRDCSFRNCGFVPRRDTVGCIGIHSNGFETAVNYDIRIEKCSFADSDVGVHLYGAKDVQICGCKYENLKEDIRLT